MSKILVTGASGFVGSFLVKEALDRGLEVYAGVRQSSSRALLTDHRINFFNLDFENQTELESQLKRENFDYIIQNAGLTRAISESQYFRVNVDYSVHLAKSALFKSSELKKYIFISSMEAFGSADNAHEGVISEAITPSPRTIYGKSKLRAEQALKEIDGLPYIILRPTAVFGPGEKDLFTVFQTIKKYKIAPVIGTDDIKYSFVYIKDLVRVALDATLSSQVNKGYFVTDGRIHNIKHFTGAIADAFGVKPLGFTIPFGVMDALCSVTKVYDKITGNKSLINPEQVAKMKARNWDCDIAPLVRDFNFSPRYSLQEAVEETAQWYLENKWL